jgi:gliding motility-associated-like protein
MLPIRSIILFVFCFTGIAVHSQLVNFIPNKGQFHSNVLYKAQLSSGALFLEKNCITYHFIDGQAIRKYHDTHDTSIVLKGHVLKIWFEGCNENISTREEELTSEYYNFFIGNDPSKWAGGIHGSHKVTLLNIYRNIDVEFFSAQGNLKYNFIVHPGGDPSVIKLRYEGQDGLSISDGNLQVQTIFGTQKEEAPLTYQDSKPVENAYLLEDKTIKFSIGKYSRRKELVIDPRVVFSSYSGSFADNWGFTGTYDNSGNGYSGGTVYDVGYPVTTGAYQTQYKGGVWVNGPSGELARDCGILKYNSTGSALIYATYLGGSHNEQPHSMVVNNEGDLIVMGTTWSQDFPIPASGFDNTQNGISDIFVVKFSPDGKQLKSGTFIGGSQRDGLNGTIDFSYFNPSPLAYNYGDICRGEVIVDGNDNVYFASTTESTPAEGFPIRNGFETNFGGKPQDGCVFKLDKNLSAVLWSTYIGSSSYDASNALCLDRNNNLFVVGGTTTTMSFTFNGASKNYAGGIADGYVVKINSSNGALLNASFIGTNAYDQAYFVQTDSTGNVYVTGQTAGNFPVFPSTIYNNPNSGQYIIVFNNNLDGVQRSMVFGNKTGKPNISPSAFLVDKCNHIFVSGWGGEENQPDFGLGHGGYTFNMETTTNAYQRSTDGSDFYVAIFSKNLQSLLYATYFGANTPPREAKEHVDGGTSRFDREGIIYQSVCAGCGSSNAFPTSAGAWSRTNNSDNCNNALFKIDFENLNRAPVVEDSVYTVNYLDTLTFDYQTLDPDFDDSIYTYFSQAKSLSGKVLNPVIGPSVKPGIGKSLSTFRYTADCNSKNDSFYIKVFVRDVGCPGTKSDTATIKIKFLPPTVPLPPKVLCMTFLDVNSIRIRWDSFVLDKYFSHYVLYRTAGSQTVPVDTFFRNEVPEYTDHNAFNYDTKNYCYKIIGYNVCNEAGPVSYDACSLREYNTPIDSTYIFTATVEGNKNIKLVWLKSHEKDFFSYQIYRKRTESGKPSAFSLYHVVNDVNDTIFIDSNVNVAEVQYCYNMKVTDYCGHISHFTNIGCNIILRGNASPFMHNLSWIEYQDWLNGVKNYDLYRKDDRNINTRETITPPGLRGYEDKNLDYDWGGYWYYVLAHQDDTLQATSQSNTVYLYQPPLLWVPNAFSSNNDGLNDTWGIVPVFVKEYQMRVYNRWGQIVFESKDKHQDWDGTYNGRTAFDEVLVWIVEYTGWDNRVYYKHGTLTILN